MRGGGVLAAVGVARSAWCRRRVGEPGRQGRKPEPVPERLGAEIRRLAHEYPWWGYKRLAVIARRSGLGVSNRHVYKVMKAEGLLSRRRVRKAELYQAAHLFDLLPSGPNQLRQSDVTICTSPGTGGGMR